MRFDPIVQPAALLALGCLLALPVTPTSAATRDPQVTGNPDRTVWTAAGPAGARPGGGLKPGIAPGRESAGTTSEDGQPPEHLQTSKHRLAKVRLGGDTIEDATVIPALPFTDDGTTCGYANDYDESCPYQGSSSADVVYRFTPSAPTAITVDLCASSYDTKLYVYAGQLGNLIACNDDAGCGYSGWQSKLSNVELDSGVTYYIVIDGYGGGCGAYNLLIYDYAPCVVLCPAGGIPENEPPCGPGYIDDWNGGCDFSPGRFQALGELTGGCIDLCGKSGTFTVQDQSYRDTDWFSARGTGRTVSIDCTAEFPVRLLFIFRADCNDLGYDINYGNPCEVTRLSHYIGNGVEFWVMVAPQVFTGVPCDADYLLNVCTGSIDPPPGACCDPSTGECTYVVETECSEPCSPWFPGVPCDPNPCPADPPVGACCDPSGGCTVVACAELCPPPGVFHEYVQCTPDPCEAVPAVQTTWGRIKQTYR